MDTAAPASRPHDPGSATLLVCSLLAGCVGTPTADPPDFLPTPRVSLTEVESTGIGPQSFGPIEIRGDAGAVDPTAELWIVNLDDLDANNDPQVLAPNGDGSFAADVEGNVGDRLRIVSRTRDRHSLPLDLEAVSGANVISISQLRDQGLDCLVITPAGEMDLGATANRAASFELKNECEGDVVVTRAALRFGDTSIELVGPAQVAAGASETLDLTLTGALSEELWDIVLLDVAVGTRSGRYALSVWAR